MLDDHTLAEQDFLWTTYFGHFMQSTKHLSLFFNCSVETQVSQRTETEIQLMGRLLSHSFFKIVECSGRTEILHSLGAITAIKSIFQSSFKWGRSSKSKSAFVVQSRTLPEYLD